MGYARQYAYGPLNASGASLTPSATPDEQMWQVREKSPRGPAAGDRPLKVAHIGNSLVRGGVEQWLRSLIRFTDRRKLRFTRCVILSRFVDPAMANDLGMPVEIGGFESVRRAIEDSDIVLCSGPVEAEWLRANGHRKLCVFVAHGDSDWVRDYIHACRDVADHVVAVSRRVGEQICHDIPKSIITNGVDTSHIASCSSRAAMRDQLGFAPDDFVLGYVGRFFPEKNVELLIETASRAPDHYKLLLVGWGIMQDHLRELAERSIPGRYVMVAADRYLGDFYRAMDAFCLPSTSEGFALVLLEAMLCGVPVIATPVGSAPEIIENRINGMLAEPCPEKFLSAAALLERHPHWAKAIASEAMHYAETHGHALRMARDYEQLLHQLWAAKHGSPSEATAI